MFDLFVIALMCFVFAKGKRALISYQRREEKWRSGDARQRERIVRGECTWRVLGRLLGASGLVIGALTLAAPGLAVIWSILALRVIRPVGAEMSDACSYRSTGKSDEQPYSW
jgi:hypothetical protein